MPADHTPPHPGARKAAAAPATGPRPLTPAAERALAEAAARRAELDRRPGNESKEVGGRGDLDATRYSDWEVNGLASDF